MRKIKFRAWDKDNQKMFYDVSVRENHFCVYRKSEGWLSISGEICEQSSIILMQFTGLKDKNGTEIYEGDILSYAGLDGYLIVKWETFGWRLENTIPEIDRYIQRLSWPPIQLPSGNFEYIEVIGNIHQNPKLLKK